VAVELSADELRGALATLERRDPQLATDAKEAVEWLAWRESEDEPLVFGQHTLQGFLWYVLPNKWDAPDDDLVAVAHALGELLDAAGALDRYVALCRSPETEQVIRSAGDGFVELMDSSGLEPPDTPLLEWSDLMTIEESEERAAASLYLEAAIEGGELEPATPGWRERQREVMEAFLTTPDESGGTPLERVRAARIESWLGPPGRTDELGGDRPSRLSALVPLLEQEPDAEAAALALDPLLWLLDVCAAGAQLTPTNALARSIVQEAVERYPSWWLPELGKPPQQETQVYPLGLLHELALDLGLVRRRRRELRLSRRGRELRADPRALLGLVAAELADVAAFGADVAFAVALAEGDGATDIPELPILVAAQLDVLTPFAGLTGPLWERRRLTEGGRTLALAILRAGATGTRHSSW
jgi:hypothetical protein